MLKEIRNIAGGLSPEDIRIAAARPLRIGLLATSEDSFRAMETFLCEGARDEAQEMLHRAALEESKTYDFLLCEPGAAVGPLPANGYRFDRRDPGRTAEAVVAGNAALELPLGHNFPQFRKAVAEKIIHRISSENALFSVVSALPNVVPNALELPWTVGEFATDTAFLTMNQIRMALQLAATHNRPVGILEQKAQIAAIVGGAFGWRALARELAGKIPLGGGLIPKAAIAFAGTWVLGLGLEQVNRAGRSLSRRERREAYADALQKGKAVVRDRLPSIPGFRP